MRKFTLEDSIDIVYASALDGVTLSRVEVCSWMRQPWCAMLAIYRDREQRVPTSGTGYLCAKDKPKGLWPVGIASKRPILERKEMRRPLQDRGLL